MARCGRGEGEEGEVVVGASSGSAGAKGQLRRPLELAGGFRPSTQLPCRRPALLEVLLRCLGWPSSVQEASLAGRRSSLLRPLDLNRRPWPSPSLHRISYDDLLPPCIQSRVLDAVEGGSTSDDEAHPTGSEQVGAEAAASPKAGPDLDFAAKTSHSGWIHLDRLPHPHEGLLDPSSPLVALPVAHPPLLPLQHLQQPRQSNRSLANNPPSSPSSSSPSCTSSSPLLLPRTNIRLGGTWKPL